MYDLICYLECFSAFNLILSFCFPVLFAKMTKKKVFYIPNHLLASMTIVNIQRTAHQWHEFWIHVSLS